MLYAVMRVSMNQKTFFKIKTTSSLKRGATATDRPVEPTAGVLLRLLLLGAGCASGRGESSSVSVSSPRGDVTPLSPLPPLGSDVST